MNPLKQHQQNARREFLTTTASGLGAMALGSMLTDDGVLCAANVIDADSQKSDQAATL